MEWSLAFFFSSRRRHTRYIGDWSSDVCSSDLARRFGEDEETWGVVGLLHDLDYEKHPSQEAGHPFVGVELLRARGLDERLCRAILSHADYSGVARESLMEKSLFAADELAGFVIAVALVKPTKTVAEVDVSSVKRKM